MNFIGSDQTSNNAQTVIRNILIIDDDMDDYLLMRERLEKVLESKYILKWAPTFEKGRELLFDRLSENIIFDAVLVDYNLGAHNGLEILREAKEKKYPAPIILLAGVDRRDIDLEAMQSGAALYLTKDEANSILLERMVRYAIGLRQKELALEESDRKLRTQAALLDYINDALISSDARYRITAWNKAAETLYGWTAEEALGQYGLELLKTEFPEKSKLSMLKEIAEAGYWRGEATQVNRSGQRFSVEVSSIVLYDENHTINGYLSVNRDITERKQAETILKEANFLLQQQAGELEVQAEELHVQTEELASANARLQASEIRLSDFLESTHDTFFALDRNWCFVYINQRFARQFGRDVNSLISCSFWEELPGYLGTPVEANFRIVMEKREPVHFEITEVYSQDWYDISVYPTQEGISVFATDRTEEHRSEVALRESEARLRESDSRFRIALSNPSIAVFSTDIDLRYTWFYSTGMGALSESAIGKQDAEIFPGRGAAEFFEAKRQAIETRTAVREEIFLQIDIMPEPIIVEVSIEPLIDEMGLLIGVIGACFNVTEQRKLEAEKREHLLQMELHRRLLEYREKERQGIARDLHDGPVQDLSGLLFNIQYTKEANQDQLVKVELEQIALQIKQTIQELRGTINELRPPSLIRFGIYQAIQLHVEDFQDKHPGIEVRLTTKLGDGKNETPLPEQVNLTLFRIYQEAMNNIARHSQATRVWIFIDRQAEQIVLELHDNGMGFPISTELNDHTQKNHFGLAGMSERADAVGGTLVISSEPGKGTKIIVSIPIKSNSQG
jgi:PAS domain S-box-containing protein